jgi:hypothetical protein
VDLSLLGLSTFLGPPVVLCHWCGHPVETERLEWRQFRRWAKVWFLGVSLLYVILGGLLGGLSFDLTYELSRQGEGPARWRFGETSFIAGCVFWAVLVIVIQAYRVHCSLIRSRLKGVAPLKGSFFSVQLGLHTKALLLLILPPLVGWGGHWLWHTLGR